MSIKEVIEQLEELKCHCSDMAKWIDEDTNVWTKDIEALNIAIKALENEETILKENEETILKDNKVLKNRCRVLSQGLLCLYCPLDCEKRVEEFRKVED